MNTTTTKTTTFRATFKRPSDGKLGYIFGQHHTEAQFMQILEIKTSYKGADNYRMNHLVAIEAMPKAN